MNSLMSHRSRSGLTIAFVAMLTFGGCAASSVEAPSWRGPSLAHQQRLVADAEAFMAEYGRLLLAGDRAGIAALYDPDGAILVRGGRRIVATMDEIIARYRDRWGPPQSFEWRDLHYEAAGPDAVVVLGKFAWGEGSGSPEIGLYNALLRRHQGRLVIRIEDEAPLPPPR